MATEAASEKPVRLRIRPVAHKPAKSLEEASTRFELAMRLLGEPRRKVRGPVTAVQAHALIREGLPASSLLTLLKEARAVAVDQMLFVLDISERTRDRLKRTPKKRLALEQSDRLWRYAEVLAAAIEVFGSREAAEEWLTAPAMALDRQAPLDLLSTAPGAQLVEDLLTRLRYNVYT